jgi:hypothetical protein
MGENWGRSLRAIFWKKAQYLSRKICYSFPGKDILPSWTVHMKFVRMLDQRNTTVFALIVRQLGKPFGLLKQCPHWYNSAKRHWMTFPLGILWDCSGSPDTLGYVEMKLPSSILRGGTVHQFVGPELALGFSRQNIRPR